MPGFHALRTRLFAALLLIGAATIAALFAHVAIDLAGDVMLAHDSYDGLDHHSRSTVLILLVMTGIGTLLRGVWLTLEEAHTRRPSTRPTFDEIFGSCPLPFLCAVATLTLAMLLGMEWFDVAADGGATHDVRALLGGSVMLGLSITLCSAAFVALGVRRIARFAMRTQRVLVTLFGRLLLALRSPSSSWPGTGFGVPEGGVSIGPRSILARRCGKRGPPLPAA